MAETMRAFIALETPDSVKGYLNGLQQELRTRIDNIRWVRPENIHLTLKFLGEIDIAQVASIATVLDNISLPCGEPALEIKGLGVFPGIKRPRVIWSGIAGDTAGLMTMQKDLEMLLEKIGFKKEPRRFTAHLTIGRIKGRIDPKQIVAAINEVSAHDPVLFEVKRLLLLQSRLRPEGAVYSQLHSVTFETDSVE
ncbi:MAG: RNA 2',3'-cyclic phosphodiesterase [Desulfobacteraceae bacterium]|nr:RNA 2',3'-cyclic phosphodiesterase [Desulfobacteraceae bacterium]